MHQAAAAVVATAVTMHVKTDEIALLGYIVLQYMCFHGMCYATHRVKH